MIELWLAFALRNWRWFAIPIAVGGALIYARVALNSAYDRGKRDAEAACATAAAAATAADAETRGGITYYAGVRAEFSQAQIRETYRTLFVEIPSYVTAQADAACTIPVGFVRLHNAAASGHPVPLPDAAAEPNDAPSPVALSAVAGTVVGNYGVCLGVRQQLADLQGWVAAQLAARP
jgi:hypothetical protein